MAVTALMAGQALSATRVSLYRKKILFFNKTYLIKLSMYDISRVFGHQLVLRELLAKTAPLHASVGMEPRVIL